MIDIRVLIVDDDPIVCDGLKMCIPWNELDADLIGAAGDGEEAYRMALIEHPDLIITDIKMPVMDGLELCKKVFETMADTSIIILSAHEDFEYARTAMKYGIKFYILKPIDREKINHLIDQIKSLSEQYNKKKSFYKSICNMDLEKNFSDALKSADNGFFTDFFEDRLPALDIKNSEVKELCIKLVDILFDYLKNIGLDIDAAALSKEDVMDGLFNQKTRSDIESHTHQLYLDVLQFASHKKDSHADSLVIYVKNYLDENYFNCNLSVTSIADKLKISAAYLSIIFRNVAGINISTYISDLRVEKASELLKTPGLKMTTICSNVGYQDAQYFAKVFKRIKGVTPSEYRNLVLNGGKSGG